MKLELAGTIDVLIAFLLAPLLPGIINRVKAVCGGRRGQPLLQCYHDVIKLLKKGAVYSRTTSHVLRAGAVIAPAAMVAALLLLPVPGRRAVMSFTGDVVLWAYLLGVARFFTMAAALDTGSSFEGMGASREAFFSALCEPVLLLVLLLMGMHSSGGPVAALVAVALIIVLLSENSRIPFDDPNTHLELTMIHEVMVLDHGGPDFGFITYAAALKLWMYGMLFSAAAVLPVFRPEGWLPQTGVFLASMVVFAVIVGMVESLMARLRLTRVPQAILAGGALCVLAIAFALR
ncbi:MAG: hypothetical protein A2583_04340 [Bdellovibrionales bacterium RIFOXYD1_FULL_53_11]|nr:MAG: hypothetical protein A2583_04340 [Bdellovibrionales bacterium RIFOXYD1_FULL_53_11]